jgi:hypothetical protein
MFKILKGKKHDESVGFSRNLNGLIPVLPPPFFWIINY